ncbi:MAG: hypothetical protein SGILL_001100 [Bacillariaceae sp.]
MTATAMSFENPNPSLDSTIIDDVPEASAVASGLEKNHRRVSQETLCTLEGSSFLDESTSDGEFDFKSDSSSSPSLDEVAESSHQGGQLTARQVESSKEEDCDTDDEDNNDNTSRIKFSTISIRSYAMILGDNPSVSNGVPVSIGWDHQDEVTCDIQEYESSRSERRERTQLLLPSSIRAQLAMESGSSRRDLQGAQRRVNIHRGQRQRTLERSKLVKVEEAMENTWKVLSGKKKKEKAFLQKAMVHW